MIIGGWQKLSLIDYPRKLATVIFTQGCNFRCPYCHNPELLGCRKNTQPIPAETMFDYLAKRTGLLEGVVITGGEPTLQADLTDFIGQIKDFGYSVKLDTNGSRPQVVLNLLRNNLLDYIAMDIKAPLEKYKQVAGCSVDTESIKRSINIIANSGVDFQFRTTLARPFLDFNDAVVIDNMIRPNGVHLQGCQVDNALNKSLRIIPQFSAEDIREFQRRLADDLSDDIIPDSVKLISPFSFPKVAL